jgi:hypothetical protein
MLRGPDQGNMVASSRGVSVKVDGGWRVAKRRNPAQPLYYRKAGEFMIGEVADVGFTAAPSHFGAIIDFLSHMGGRISEIISLTARDPALGRGLPQPPIR